jgi:toxin CcdB
MAQFYLYKNPNKATQKTFPYLLDIQSSLLEDLRTTVVIPLQPKRLADTHSISRLNPVIKIKSEHFVVMTQNLAGVDRNVLGEKVSDLGHLRPEIIAAIDFMLSGI